MELTTRRTFWLALGWLGLAQSLEWAVAVLRVGVWPGNAAALVGFGLLTVVAGVGVARPDQVGGPTERRPLWWAAIVAAVLATLTLLV